jgi:dienelactone hydrolase
MHRFLLAAIVSTGAGSSAATAQAAREIRLPVGFAVLVAPDSARLAGGQTARPIQIAIWYPSVSRAGAAMTYRDYVELVAGERGALITAEAKAAAVADVTAPLHAHGVPDSLIDRWLNRPMVAIRGVPSRAGRFPLVLIAQGNGESPHDQVVLAELLASRGYLVATTPSPMRIAERLTDENQTGRRAQEQADDLAFTVDWMRPRTDVDPSRLAIIGHSFGVRGGLLLAMQRPVLALVSLDGGIGTSTGFLQMRCAIPADSELRRTSILHFYEEVDPFMKPDFTLLLGLRSSERWLVHVTGMHHHHFTSLGTIGNRDTLIRAATGGDSFTLMMAELVNAATVQFLDATVKRQPTALARLERGSLLRSFDRMTHLAAGEGTAFGAATCSAAPVR